MNNLFLTKDIFFWKVPGEFQIHHTFISGYRSPFLTPFPDSVREPSCPFLPFLRALKLSPRICFPSSHKLALIPSGADIPLRATQWL